MKTSCGTTLGRNKSKYTPPHQGLSWGMFSRYNELDALEVALDEYSPESYQMPEIGQERTCTDIPFNRYTEK